MKDEHPEGWLHLCRMGPQENCDGKWKACSRRKTWTRVVRTSLVPAPALTLASPRGRAAPSDFKLLFRSCKEKKKSYKKETRVNGFAAVVALLKSQPLEGNFSITSRMCSFVSPLSLTPRLGSTSALIEIGYDEDFCYFGRRG